MHIKDLKKDVELDSAAMATVRGGCGPAAFCLPEQPEMPVLPSFEGDWDKFNTDVESYIGEMKAGAGIPERESVMPSVPTIEPGKGYMPG